MNVRKKMLLSVVVLALAALLTGGTLATFSAKLSNPDSGFQTGTLVLSETDFDTPARTCISTDASVDAANTNSSCFVLFDLTGKKPGDAPVTVRLNVKNEGSLNAASLKAFAEAACTNGDAGSESYHGAGDLCAKVQFYVQQYTDDTWNDTTSTCLYGGGTAAVCDFDATHTLDDFGANHQVAAPLSFGALDAGSSVYVKLGVQLPSDADNTYQGRKATLAFSWLLEQ